MYIKIYFTTKVILLYLCAEASSNIALSEIPTMLVHNLDSGIMCILYMLHVHAILSVVYFETCIICGTNNSLRIRQKCRITKMARISQPSSVVRMLWDLT